MNRLSECQKKELLKLLKIIYKTIKKSETDACVEKKQQFT